MKSKTLATLLAFFLGGLGAHKFYLGQTGKGILYLLFVWTSIPAILGLIESIYYLTMSEYNFNKKFNKSGNNSYSSSYIEIQDEHETSNSTISHSKSYMPNEIVSEDIHVVSNEAIGVCKPIQTTSLADARRKMASAVKNKTK